MSSEIRLNPFVTLYPDPRETGRWVIQAPKPGSGLCRLQVDELRFAKLFELCEEAREDALRYFDLDADLTDEERAAFVDANILVKENEPKQVLFSCRLDAVAPQELPREETLIFNPNARFEPFDLTKFRTWATAMHLSPYLPTVWVKDACTGLESGYWLTNDEASALAGLRPGEPPPNLPPGLAGRLFAANIIVSRGDSESAVMQRHEQIAAAGSEFREKGYSIVRHVIPQTQIPAVRTFYQELEAEGFMFLGDERVPDRFVYALEPFAGTLHRGLTTLMSTIAGREVKPSYNYASSYLGGSELRAHRDRPQCEFSFSLQVDYRPEPVDGVSPWPLCLSIDGREIAIHLANGDLLAYKGCEVTHYRPRLPEDHRSTSLFLHYVPVEYDGPLA